MSARERAGIIGSQAMKAGQKIVIRNGVRTHVWEVLMAGGQRLILKHYMFNGKHNNDALAAA